MLGGSRFMRGLSQIPKTRHGRSRAGQGAAADCAGLLAASNHPEDGAARLRVAGDAAKCHSFICFQVPIFRSYQLLNCVVQISHVGKVASMLLIRDIVI